MRTKGKWVCSDNNIKVSISSDLEINVFEEPKTIALCFDSDDKKFICKAVNNFEKMKELLSTMTTLCRLKYGNLDAGVYQKIQASF